MNIKFIPVHINNGEIPQYVEILSKKRDRLYKYMKKHFIDCRIFYPNLSNVNQNKSENKNVYENSDNFEKFGLYLPSGPDLNLQSINKVSNVIEKFYKK